MIQILKDVIAERVAAQKQVFHAPLDLLDGTVKSKEPLSTVAKYGRHEL
jgi:hypothetical protein